MELLQSFYKCSKESIVCSLIQYVLDDGNRELSKDRSWMLDGGDHGGGGVSFYVASTGVAPPPAYCYQL
ncbi:hypothetical protein M8C21_002482 [Ambrosia artemisiifolia]|uniref:Uncharacterized protein n=1 Tax=Ambrosia artemisiifolia TaxID=4212 RepID=A0AAD5CVV7_AMBAR|nr:hypothetical protein M8C21_002482 [Ambrosia artemisiifolia]